MYYFHGLSPMSVYGVESKEQANYKDQRKGEVKSL